MKHNDLILYLNSNGIWVTQEDLDTMLDTLAIFERNQSKQWESRLANEQLNTIYYDISAGKVLGIIAFAAVGFFLAPVLGIGAIAGALIGASIGWRLFGGADKNQNQKQERQEKTVQTFGFNSAPSIAPIGGVVPIVFTNKQLNPNGGVRTSGVLLHSRVDTWGGVQRLYTLYGLCLGEINEIGENSILINNQPRTSFFSDEISTQVKLGTETQPPSGDFPYYSQCISVSVNNQLGVSKRGTYTGTTGNTSTISVSADDFDAFSPTDRYLLDNLQTFTILSKNQSNNSFQISNQISVNNGATIYSRYQIKYETSKSCTELHLNLVANLWARNEKNELLQNGVFFDLVIDNVFIGRFLMSNKSESDIRRRIIIRNLPYQKHNIDLIPYPSASDSRPIYKLGDNQQISRIDNVANINGKQIQIEYEQSPGVFSSVTETNNIIGIGSGTTKKQQSSNDRGAVAQLTTVNEIVYPADIGQKNLATYKNIATGGLIALASNRLQSDPAPSWELRRATKGREHIAAGFANASSTDLQLNDISANFLNDSIPSNQGFILRNLDQGIETNISNVSQNSLVTSTPLFWRQGDRYLVYRQDQSLCYFPDIYVWTLTQRLGGLGGLLRGTQLADYFVDYVSIVNSRKYCVANNYFWDGQISQPVAWASWASNESISSLLFPTRIGGKFGLVPEQASNPVMMFNASNILPDSYVEEYAPKQKLNCVHVTYQDNTSGQPREKTVSIMTREARNGTEVLSPESLRLESVTNKNQAIRVGQIYLNSRLLQDRVIQFTTGMQGYGLREGNLIIVQHIVTELEKECSGFAQEALPYNMGTQKIVLSSPSFLGFNDSYSAAVYRLETGTIQKDLVCVGVREGNPARNVIEIRGLSSELKASRENFTGDYVVIGKDTTHRRTYRVQKIEPQENGSVNITAVLWVPEILDGSNLVVID